MLSGTWASPEVIKGVHVDISCATQQPITITGYSYSYQLSAKLTVISYRAFVDNLWFMAITITGITITKSTLYILLYTV